MGDFDIAVLALTSHSSAIDDFLERLRNEFPGQTFGYVKLSNSDLEITHAQDSRLFHFKAVVLLHSVQEGRNSITDVPDAKYSILLPQLTNRYGNHRVAVVVYALPSLQDSRKKEPMMFSFQKSQPTTFKCSSCVIQCFDFGTLDMDSQQMLTNFLKEIEEFPFPAEKIIDVPQIEHEIDLNAVQKDKDEESNPNKKGRWEVGCENTNIPRDTQRPSSHGRHREERRNFKDDTSTHNTQSAPSSCVVALITFSEIPDQLLKNLRRRFRCGFVRIETKDVEYFNSFIETAIKYSAILVLACDRVIGNIRITTEICKNQPCKDGRDIRYGILMEKRRFDSQKGNYTKTKARDGHHTIFQYDESEGSDQYFSDKAKMDTFFSHHPRPDPGTGSSAPSSIESQQRPACLDDIDAYIEKRVTAALQHGERTAIDNLHKHGNELLQKIEEKFARLQEYTDPKCKQLRDLKRSVSDNTSNNNAEYTDDNAGNVA